MIQHGQEGSVTDVIGWARWAGGSTAGRYFPLTSVDLPANGGWHVIFGDPATNLPASFSSSFSQPPRSATTAACKRIGLLGDQRFVAIKPDDEAQDIAARKGEAMHGTKKLRDALGERYGRNCRTSRNSLTRSPTSSASTKRLTRW